MLNTKVKDCVNLLRLLSLFVTKCFNASILVYCSPQGGGPNYGGPQGWGGGYPGQWPGQASPPDPSKYKYKKAIRNFLQILAGFLQKLENPEFSF